MTILGVASLVIGHFSEPPEISHTKPYKIRKKVIYSKIRMSYPHNLIFGSKSFYIKVDFIKFYHVTNPFSRFSRLRHFWATP